MFSMRPRYRKTIRITLRKRQMGRSDSIPSLEQRTMKTKSDTYKGKTAKHWYKLHEVMRKDFSRVLGELNAAKMSIKKHEEM